MPAVSENVGVAVTPTADVVPFNCTFTTLELISKPPVPDVPVAPYPYSLKVVAVGIPLRPEIVIVLEVPSVATVAIVPKSEI